MNIKLVLRLVGRVMAAESFTLFFPMAVALLYGCLLYTSDAADE